MRRERTVLRTKTEHRAPPRGAASSTSSGVEPSKTHGRAVDALQRHGEPRLGADPSPPEAHSRRPWRRRRRRRGWWCRPRAHAGASIIIHLEAARPPSTSLAPLAAKSASQSSFTTCAVSGSINFAPVSSLSSHAGASGEKGAFAGLFEGGQPRRPSSPVTTRQFDLCAGVHRSRRAS